jgi:low temperature requirement protein LtrA
VTQTSQFLLHHLDLAGALRAVFLLLVVWWAWIYTAWMTNWFDPEQPVVRVVLLAVMLAGLVMSIVLPEAFGARAFAFALAYVVLQGVRDAFAARAMPADMPNRASFVRILAWWALSAPVWLAAALAGGRWLTAGWLLALTLDYAAPLVGYWTPWSGASTTTDWNISASHFAERFQLFMIIALGESIVATGATASGTALGASTLVAVSVAFGITAAMWWLYFDYVAEIAQRRLDASDDAGRLGRDAYTYIHIPMVAGIIADAVGAELMIADPGATLAAAGRAALCGGAALYLLGHVAFRLRMAGSLSRKRLGTALALVALAVVGAVLPALVLGTAVLAALVALIVAEILTGPRRRARRLAEAASLSAAEAG